MLVHDELSIRAEIKGTNRTANKDDMKRLCMVIVDRTLAADAWFCPQAQRLPGGPAKHFPFMVCQVREARDHPAIYGTKPWRLEAGTLVTRLYQV